MIVKSVCHIGPRGWLGRPLKGGSTAPVKRSKTRGHKIAARNHRSKPYSLLPTPHIGRLTQGHESLRTPLKYIIAIGPIAQAYRGAASGCSPAHTQ